MTTTIPGVREQVRRWTGGRPPKDADEPQRETFGHRDLKVLGNVGRAQFGMLPDGRELKLRGPVMPYELERAPDDAVIVTRPARTDGGRVMTETFIGRPVESGTFERLSARKRYAPRERRVGPVDGHAQLRKATDRLPVRLGTDDDSPMGIIKGAMSHKPTLLVTDGADMPLTVIGLIEAATAAGANLRHHNGHTLADWTRAGRWRPLLVALWPLVHAHLAGTPLGCAYEHEGTPPPADTRDPAGVAVCNEHVGMRARTA